MLVWYGADAGRAVAQAGASPYAFQVGLEAAEFVKLLEEQTEPDAYSIVARWTRGEHYAWRGGMSYSHSTQESGTTELGLRLGYDRSFVRDGRWHFYAGLDAIALHEAFGGGSRRTYKAGLSPLVGFMFFISPRFSLATEPRFAALYNRFTDDDTFRRDNTDTWYTFKLGGIGSFQINFHF